MKENGSAIFINKDIDEPKNYIHVTVPTSFSLPNNSTRYHYWVSSTGRQCSIIACKEVLLHWESSVRKEISSLLCQWAHKTEEGQNAQTNIAEEVEPAPEKATSFNTCYFPPLLWTAGCWLVLPHNPLGKVGWYLSPQKPIWFLDHDADKTNTHIQFLKFNI